MNKKLSTIEILLLINFTVFFVLSFIINFACNGKEAMGLMSDSFGLAINVFSKGTTASKLFLVTIVLFILAFTAYWIVNIFRYKKITLGPIYFVLFFGFFLYTNGYTNLIVDIDAYVVILVMTLIWLLASAIICFTVYLKELKKMEEGEIKE